MGMAILGGLFLGTVLTLYVVPAMYTYLASRKARSTIFGSFFTKSQ